MRKKFTHREKKQLWIIGIIICFLLLLWTVFSPFNGILHHVRVNKKLRETVTENKKIQEQNRTLEKEIDKLEEEDPQYIEEVARKKYGLIKKNEIIFKFKSKKKTH